MRQTILLEKNIEVLVVSAGGVGTTFLMEAIGQYKKTNCSSNTDGYKHLPIPPISRNRNLKVIYVFGNPMMACVSLFRRKYHHTQSIKAQQYLKKGLLISKETSLVDYAANGEDGFYFERHLQYWTERFSIYPTLFLKYETLFEHLQEVADFLELPAEFVMDFPKKRNRESQLSKLDAETVENLEKLYGKLAKKIAARPSVEIQNQGMAPNFKKLWARPYYRGMQKLFWKKMPLLRRIKNLFAFLSEKN